jgi:hypothetical protein
MEEPKVCLFSVAVRPMMEASKYSEHLAPEVVDGAVALVGNDDVEGLDGYGGIVFYWRDFFVKPYLIFPRIPRRLLQAIPRL